MASIILDLTLCVWDTFEPTEPDSPERALVVSQILAAAGADPARVKFHVLQEVGPAGGNPECEFLGPRSEIEKVVGWFVEMQGEGSDWADEYWTDRD
jgi:hypothetical protein